MSEPMKILLLEDDNKTCDEFKNIIKDREDIVLSRVTNSSDEALKLMKKYKYDGVIVDLELHYGRGSGINFLEDLRKLELKPKPVVIVNTNIMSDIVYDKIHNGLADIIYHKKQKDYSIENIVNMIVSLRNEDNQSKVIIETPEDREKTLISIINSEMDLIGISYKLKGREYMVEAMLYMLGDNVDENISAFQYVASKNKLLASSISRAMQTAINETWRKSSVDDLREHYTAKINYNTGVPTPTEFLYYYVEKIRKMTEID